MNFLLTRTRLWHCNCLVICKVIAEAFVKTIAAVCAFFIFSSVAFSMIGSEVILKTCKDSFPFSYQQECKTITEGKTFDLEAVQICGKAFQRQTDLMTCWKVIANKQYLPGAPTECHSLSASSSYLFHCLATQSQAPRKFRN